MNSVMLETKTEIATGRSNVYGLLAALFREELSIEQLRQMKDSDLKNIFSAMGIPCDKLFSVPEADLIEDLAVEYARLFLGPDKHFSPHESIYHKRDDGDWGVHWGASTVEVKKFIETAGMQYKSEYTGMPDHISVELEFMQEAVKREGQALEEMDLEGALYCLRMEKKFIEEHLIQWVPLFCDTIIAAAEIPFYGELAHITKGFVMSELDEINNTIPFLKEIISSPQLKPMLSERPKPNRNTMQ